MTLNQLAKRRTPLFVPRQGEAQWAYVRLLEDHQVVLTESEPNHFACTAARYFGVEIWWAIDPCTTGAALAALLRSPEAQALLERVKDGHEVAFDGNNWRGTLTHDAAEARRLFQSLCDELEVA